MTTESEKQMTKLSGDGKVTTPRGNKAIIFMINLAFALPYIITHLSAPSFVASSLLLGILAYAMLFKGDGGLPAAAYFGSVVFTDFLVFCALNFSQISEVFDSEAIGPALEHLIESPFFTTLTLLGIGAALWVVATNKPAWTASIGLCVAGVAVIISQWNQGELVLWENVLSAIQLAGNARALLFIYIASGLFWTVLQITVLAASPFFMRKAVLVESFVIWLGGMLIIIGANSFVKELVADYTPRLLSLGDTALAWWKVVVACGILLIISQCMRGSRDYHKAMGIDSFSIAVSASVLLAIRVAMSNYFIYSWAALLAFIGLSARAIQNEAQEKKTLGLAGEVHIAATTVAAIWALVQLHNGMVPLVITALSGLAAIVWGRKAFFGEGGNIRGYICLAIFFAALALSWIVIKRWSFDGLMMIGIILALGIAAIVALAKSYPDLIGSFRNYYVAICAVLLLLNIFAMRETLHIETSVDAGTVSARVKALGDHEIAEAKYTWYSAIGEVLSEGVLGNDGKVDGEGGRVLIIEATDEDGARTMHTTFIPILPDAVSEG